VVNPADRPALADNIVVHQGVSPNGDGMNDVLVIDGIAAYPDNKLSVMSRNGELVFEAAGYDNNSRVFDGHSNKSGKLQQPGTYFYSLDYKVGDVTRHKTGFLVLKY
jgi:gliding motility-associated-like protein